MISFTVPNSQIALNKRMSTVNFYCKSRFRLDYLPEIIIWVGRQILIFAEIKIRNVISIFDTLVDRA